MKIFLIIVIILALLLLVRIRVQIEFGQELRVHLRIALFQKILGEKKTKEKAKKAAKSAKEKVPKPKPSAQELVELCKTVLRALSLTLRKIRRRVCIDPLMLSLSIGGSDPAKTAESYGYANAAVWTLMPMAEDAFKIPDPQIHLETNFESEQIRAEGRVGVSLRVIDVLVIALVLLIPLLKWYLRYKKAHRNDLPPIQKDTAPAGKTEQTTEETSEKTV